MSDLEFTRVTNTLAPELAKTYVVLWDIGPSKPKAPDRPVAPKGKEGDPEFDLKLIEFKQELDDYGEALKAFKQAKIDHAAWHKKNGGAIELPMYSCDAHDALERDPKRYFISASTRGHEKDANYGLPEGCKPGHGQAENVRRAQEGMADYLAARKADPVFGQEMTQ